MPATVCIYLDGRAVDAATARKTISAYRRQEHPSLSKQGVWNRSTLEIYMLEGANTRAAAGRLTRILQKPFSTAASATSVSRAREAAASAA